VVTREAAPVMGRNPGELEQIYMQVFRRFAAMIASGLFPFAAEDTESEEAPRVGDGVIVIDASGRVEYSSPNAVSTLHRLGVHANAEGLRFSELGLEETVVSTAFAMGLPVTEELPRGLDITVLMRGIPLLDHGAVTGAVVLLRDISELRRRDLLLLSKDATIREIHHRVKNNLQTISSLLRLQGRRLEAPEAKVAIEESVRRIRSIALVHEILSRAPGSEVPSADVVRPLVRMAEEGMVSEETPVHFSVEGESEQLPPRVATPLAVVLNELLQNAADHAFPTDGPDAPTPDRPGHVVVHLEEVGEDLVVQVIDDGVGVPPDFAIEDTSSLGLSIVRSLVTTQLEGTIELRHREPRGTLVELRVPLTVPAVP
jgi:two-component system, sensor histidine kinase PdtaS